MKRWLIASIGVLAVAGLIGLSGTRAAAPAGNAIPSKADAARDEVSRILNAENAEHGVKLEAIPIVDDLTFLRRVYVDLIGRIPTVGEIDEFAAMPSASRREQIVDTLIADPRFVDTWTTFYADMLRLRSNADGGAATLAYVHKALEEKVPYDQLCYRLISANGKAGANPEIGFILGDAADPMALAGVTAQVFMGLRVACAQCHDHPFDKWKRQDFYGLAAFFGKTRRVETQFTNTVYTTEVDQTTVLWPPEGMADAGERKPMKPTFLFPLEEKDGPRNHVARLEKLRVQQAEMLARKAKKSGDADIDALLADAAVKADKESSGGTEQGLGVLDEAKKDARSLNIKGSIYQQSELRMQLAEMITSPYNRYFSRMLVNRAWAQLIGRGFVEPIDDLSDTNLPSHPQTLDYLADEFVAGGFELRTLVRMIVLSEPYQRGHAVGVDELAQSELEGAFLATPMRRMLSEALYDSIVAAGYLYDVKHVAGKNMKVVWREVRVEKKKDKQDEESIATNNLAGGEEGKKMPAKPEMKLADASEYNVEKAVTLDFDAILKGAQAKAKQGVEVEQMRVMSKEEIEAMRMAQQMQQRRPNAEYIDRFIKSEIDDNPVFSSSYLMASPALPEHFLRVFGQTDRTQLGEERDHDPTMRQALLMLNGRLTHEAARVGELEPVYELLVGKKADLDGAVQLAYRAILTREPSDEEIAEAKLIVGEASNPLDGMADLRWVLLNCNEFKFLR